MDQQNSLNLRSPMKLSKIAIIVVKITEFIILLIATASVGYNVNKTRREDENVFPDPYDFGYQARLEFFMFTTSVGMIIVIIAFLLHGTEWQEKVSGSRLIAEIHVIWTIMLFVSSIMIAKTVSDLDSRNAGSTLNGFYYDERIGAGSRGCRGLVLGEIFGFVGMFLFFVDSSVYIFMFMAHQRLHSELGKQVL
ncbi:uncharacterized protein LOC114523230 [Dendronephthya gigantea]|uniref:uncharacterized protein LOC114523230 n=1 Tax=Dendronephthya gigantea TaxID=151771 RepID=UPI00106D7708|nr:uncharacterized protein LOC114523230 [Dendronephthya gigantea]